MDLSSVKPSTLTTVVSNELVSGSHHELVSGSHHVFVALAQQSRSQQWYKSNGLVVKLLYSYHGSNSVVVT